MSADTWYKREPRAFLDGVQGMGPELIGAYAVILDILYARAGDMPRDDRHLAGVLGCSLRKARALTDALIERGKISIEAGKIVNARAADELEKRRNQRETDAKPTRKVPEKAVDMNEINHLARQNRIEENITPLTPQGGRGRGSRFGLSEGAKKIMEERDALRRA